MVKVWFRSDLCAGTRVCGSVFIRLCLSVGSVRTSKAWTNMGTEDFVDRR